jgi:hypothetical protein
MKTQVTIERRRACFRGTYGMRNAITRTVKIKSEKDIQIIANVVDEMKVVAQQLKLGLQKLMSHM